MRLAKLQTYGIFRFMDRVRSRHIQITDIPLYKSCKVAEEDCTKDDSTTELKQETHKEKLEEDREVKEYMTVTLLSADLEGTG